MAAICAVGLVGKPGLANGRFPAAGLIAFNPQNTEHFAIATTFGLLESKNGGASFSWSCEFVLGVSDGEDIAVAVTANNALVVGTFTGLVTSPDGCTYSKVTEFQNEVIGDLTLSRGAPGTLVAFRLRGLGGGLFDSQLLRSQDDGQSWTRLEPLPQELLPITIDVMPSDPERVYLTARTNAASDFTSVLLRSEDGGSTFQMMPIPETAGQRLAFIAGVHPTDENVLYLRVDDPAGTVVWRTVDGGQSFEPIFTGNGRLLGFALSPQGDRVALGGAGDGLWIGEGDGSDLQRRSDVGPSCLGWNASGLYACADSALDGFSIGRTVDEAVSFQPLLQFAELCGASACADDAPLSEQCQFDWERTAPTLGATCGVMPLEDSSADAGAAMNTEADAANEEQGSAPARARGCALRPGLGQSRFVWALALGLIALRRRPRGGLRRNFDGSRRPKEHSASRSTRR